MTKLTIDELLEQLDEARSIISNVQNTILATVKTSDKDSDDKFPSIVHDAVEEARKSADVAYEAMRSAQEADIQRKMSTMLQTGPANSTAIATHLAAIKTHLRFLPSLKPWTCASKPKNLYTGDAKNALKMSYSDAVLQCFAMILDPAKIQGALGPNHLGSPSVFRDHWLKDGKIRAKSEQNRLLPQAMAPVAELLATLSRMREGSGKVAEDVKSDDQRCRTTPYFFQRTFSDATSSSNGLVKYPLDQKGDPAEYTKDILDCLAVGQYYRYPVTQDSRKHARVDAMFRIQNNFDMQCPCGKQWQTSEQSWVISLTPDDPTDTTKENDTKGLFRESVSQKVSVIICPKCGKEVPVTKDWTGLEYAPHYMIIHFNRTGATGVDQRYRVSVDLGLHGPFVKGADDKLYDIRGVIKRKELKNLKKQDVDMANERANTGKSTEEQTGGAKVYHYVAYTRSLDNKWWKCDGPSVQPCDEKKEVGEEVRDPDDGEVCLAFYQLDVPVEEGKRK